jgi:hypothetical protein
MSRFKHAHFVRLRRVMRDHRSIADARLAAPEQGRVEAENPLTVRRPFRRVTGSSKVWMASGSSLAARLASTALALKSCVALSTVDLEGQRAALELVPRQHRRLRQQLRQVGLDDGGERGQAARSCPDRCAPRIMARHRRCRRLRGKCQRQLVQMWSGSHGPRRAHWPRLATENSRNSSRGPSFTRTASMPSGASVEARKDAARRNGYAGWN